jgi:hypothetical protein
MAEMTAQEAAEWGKTLSFEKVWAALIEDRKQFREQLEATVERVSNNAGGLNRSVGELVETLIAARLWEKFPAYSLQRAYQWIPLYDDKNVRRTDMDILLAGTSICMAVEVKRELDRRGG